MARNRRFHPDTAASARRDPIRIPLGDAVKASPLITRPDRIPARRYYDADFYASSASVCGLGYGRWRADSRRFPSRRFRRIRHLDQSVIVIRVDERPSRPITTHVDIAACSSSRTGQLSRRIRLSVPRLAMQLTGYASSSIHRSYSSRENLDKADLRLRECRSRTWGGCAFIDFDDNAPPLRESSSRLPRCTTIGMSRPADEWWLAARLPVNWKLAMEAFMEGYHVMATHPQLLALGRPQGAGSLRIAR